MGSAAVSRAASFVYGIVTKDTLIKALNFARFCGQLVSDLAIRGDSHAQQARQ
jgi:hypothetical protein